MLRKNKFFHSFTLAFALLTFSSCSKDFLDINTDPNNPTRATVDLVLPTALGVSAYNLGNGYQILGGLWGQFWTQGPTASQYKQIDQYSINSTSYGRQWESVYSGPLSDFKYLVDEGTRTGQNNYAAIGKIMQAYIFQVMTDLHGDIPFSEALSANEGNSKPKFDTQEQVYDGLIVLLDQGIALIDEQSSQHPTSDDFFFNGDMHLWKKFANTLKLKIFLRQAYTRPAVAEAGVKALYAASAEFIDYQEDALVPFNTEQFNQNPLFATYQTLTSDNLIASNTVLNYLEATNDPRTDVFFSRATAAPNAGSHAGIDQGNGPNLLGNQNANSYSRPGPAVGGPITADEPDGGAAAPVIFMSSAESYFLQAEAVARGWGDGDARQLYEDGILLSFLHWDISETAYGNYVSQAAVKFPEGGSAEQKIQQIITQKWVSFCGTENLEAWNEWRRTGYPDIFEISATTSIGNIFPVRILYADSEVSRNPNTPAQKTVKDKIWWDVNTSGQN
ncbi:SusD/RagB family nutrient-binding outer membrane lipoprotein [Flavihumibacter fluvii]|uniref:SusD/RagB family nutrient-binding outer membrane lipoprotein n=1 Tax=Flavihumibacter fluvii TaxID=2838157 RepID=UPI001BDEAC99|nr:SusD/RagB family nutrient-binding outer membrane lipoprotein [Flavihumibacter fluvii]ULQ53042.1 SusD/RagB family nutrient-binding outer membrane lipoprotein [Flavihumibacter fluvii]